MNRYLLVAAVILGGSVIALLFWINSEVSEQYKDREELLESGKLKRKPGEVPAGHRKGPRAPRLGGTDVLLGLRLPEDDPRARLGGPVLLELLGNNVLLRRADPATAEYRRSLLTNAQVDTFLARAAEVAGSGTPDAPGLALEIRDAEGFQRHGVTLDAARPLLALEVPGERPLEPEAVLVRLEAVGAPPADAPRRPWPSRRSPPSGFLEAPARLEARPAVLRALIEDAREGRALGFGPEDAREHYRVISLEVVLR